MNIHRLLTVMLSAAVLTGLSGCGEVPDTVTDCETSSEPITCQRDERFEVAGTNIVVDELETITVIGGEGGDQARVEALITLDAEPEEDLQAQLHVVEPVTEDDLVVDPDQAFKAGEQTVTWDFSGKGFADRIDIGDMPPDVFIVFGDDHHEVTVIVMSVEYF